jgi:hypothetical protein
MEELTIQARNEVENKMIKEIKECKKKMKEYLTKQNMVTFIRGLDKGMEMTNGDEKTQRGEKTMKICKKVTDELLIEKIINDEQWNRYIDTKEAQESGLDV